MRHLRLQDKKIRPLFIQIVLLALSPMVSYAAEHMPEYCTVGERPLDKPLKYVQLSYDGAIEITEKARAFVTFGKDEVASTTSFSVSNVTSTRRTQGVLTITFNDECLPKGEKYTFHLAEKSLKFIDDDEATNEEYTMPFEVPADLGDAYYQLGINGNVVEMTSGFSCFWSYETRAVGNPEWEFYREGVFIRNYPASVSWDWDLGTAYLFFGGVIRFEKGVNYRIVLPAGSVSAYRTDIVNKEVVIDFVGGCDTPLPAVEYVRNFIDCGKGDVLNSVSYYYNQAVELIGTPSVQLYDATDNAVVKDVVPTLREEGTQWVVSADFGGSTLQPQKKYLIILAEGSLVSASGEIRVNARDEIDLNASNSEKLMPLRCAIGDKPVYYPVEAISYDFDAIIKVDDAAVATIYLGDEALATGKLTATNYVGAKSVQGTAIVSFDPALRLPKGNTYRLMIPDGAIYKNGQPTVCNDELAVEFEVPATIGEATPTISNGSAIKLATSIGFRYKTEVVAADGGEAVLYRNGVEVRRQACDTSRDVDFGYAGVDFGESIHFEDGVEYTLTLPAGSVCALYREDITNDEQSLTFLGAYTKELKHPAYYRCSLNEESTTTINEVSLYFDMPLNLLPEKMMVLYETDRRGSEKYEAQPTLKQAGSDWILTADFGALEIKSGKSYTVELPEGTVVTATGDILVNKTQSTQIGTSRLTDIEKIGPSVAVVDNRIKISGVNVGATIEVIEANGRVIKKLISVSESLDLDIAGQGFYIVAIDNKSFKVELR
ncbi:MAG: hypothetical protein J1F05_01885 [Muribaculaceae bacterium]|nr:hypothetical protein [Muribaculaceae bacterium]